MARFEREAKVLAALNHPNIAAIYGLEDRALVLELVEGEDLAGPLPVETAIRYALQMASALEAAREKGIVHRDLKPGNVKVTRAGGDQSSRFRTGGGGTAGHGAGQRDAVADAHAGGHAGRYGDSRFVLFDTPLAIGVSEVDVIENWFEELKRIAPVSQ